MVSLTSHDDVYIPERLPEIVATETHAAMEWKWKGKAPIELLVSTGVVPNESVPLSIFREEAQGTTQPSLTEDEPTNVVKKHVFNK